MIGENKLNSTRVIGHISLFAYAVLCILPIIIVISVSLTPQQTFYDFGMSIWPKAVTLDAYRVIFQYPKTVFDAYKITIFITVAGTILNTLVCAMCAYSLSVNKFKFGNGISLYLYFTMLFSGGLIPSYILIKQYLHMADTIWVMIIPALASPWTVFVLRTFFRNMPASIFESARIDGAYEFTIFFKIVLPLQTPALATQALAISLGYWNEWFNAMLYITKPELVPIQLFLQRMIDNINFYKMQAFTGKGIGMTNTTELPSMAIQYAMVLVTTVPIMFVFLYFQKYFVRGLTVGAVKE